MTDSPLEIYRIFGEKMCKICGSPVKIVGMRKRNYWQHHGELYLSEYICTEECKKWIKKKINKH